MRVSLLLASILALSHAAAAGPQPVSQVTISVIGTSDLHGHVASLPWLAGYLANLRAAQERAGGGVLLLDAGDMFQGTLESNLEEGAPVVRAYNALGYSAVAIGNHEFDFGPAGPAPSPVREGDDPRGALKARAAEAMFPFLAANITDKSTGKPVDWPHVKPSTMVDLAGIKVGIVGGITVATPRTALPANVAGLAFLPLAQSIAREARSLRKRGATVVIAAIHEGGECHAFAEPDNLNSCNIASEIFRVVRDLPAGSVDAVVAGHTHQALAQRIAGVPIIQSYANGRAFGRVDLIVDRASGKVIASHLEPPHDICPGKDPTTCNAKDYENEPVQPDRAVADLLAPSFAKAREKGHEKLGTQVARDMPFSRKQETALGNLLTDLMRTARTGTNPLPRAGVDVAMINGGAMRAGLPAGPLTYAHLYETFPFDNAFAYVRLPARQFRRALARSLANSSSQVSLSGLRVIASCRAGTLDVELERPDGSNIADQQVLGIATTDFLATGGDGFFQGTRASFEIGPPLREGLADALRARGGTIDPEDPALFDLAHPRIVIPSQVPVECRGRHIKAPDQAHVHHNEPQPGHG